MVHSHRIESDDALISLPGDLSRLLKRADAGYLEARHRIELSEQGKKQLSRLLLLGSGMVLGGCALLGYAFRPEQMPLLYTSLACVGFSGLGLLL